MLLAAVVAVLALSLPAVGCSAGSGEDPSAVEAPLAIDVVALAMDNTRKTAELAPDFPFQVPVFGGRVVVAESVTPGSVWAYEVQTPEPAPVVIEWYRRAYANANWVLVDDSVAPGDGLHDHMMYFTKGAGAESVIEFAEDGGGGTLIVATVALGADIRLTY